MLMAYGLSINAGMDDGCSFYIGKSSTAAKSADMQVVDQKDFDTTEKQKILNDIVEGIIYIFNTDSIFNICNFEFISNEDNYMGGNKYSVPNNDNNLLKSFLESVKSRNHNEIHRILTENPDLNIGFFASSQLTQWVQLYKAVNQSN